ncbi:major facilitator superfamily domain-containing protein [Colletotrichum cereale]|nr:major facilitator superfamily domain-containing protein [Colletotrichum cereale]
MLFAVGSIAFALANNMTGVIAGRVLQGLGGGGLDVLSEIVVTDMTTLQERSLYLGLMAIPTALGSVLGPTVGGIFSSLVTWRWLGWIILPLLGISFPLTAVFLRLRPLEHSRVSRLRTLDWVGMPLFTAGIVLFALPLSWAGNLYTWDSFRTLLPLLIEAALLCDFAFYEIKPAVPIMLHRIFRSRTASATLAGVFLHCVSLYSLLQWLPLLYQAVMAKTVLQSTVSLLPTSVMEHPIFVSFDGCGDGRLSICSTVFSSYFSRAIGYIGELPPAAEHLRDPETAVAFIPRLRTLDLPEETLLPIVQAYVTSIRAIMYAMTGFSGLGLLTSFFTSELTLQRTERGQQQFEELWGFLLARGDTRGRVPKSRYNVSACYSTDGKPGSVTTEYGYFLDENIDLGALDTSFFSMTRSQVERADPQQRLMLEVARECFDDARVTN